MEARTMQAAIFATVCIAWAGSALAQCQGDFNGDWAVTIDERVVAVDNALNGCQVRGPRLVDNGDGTVTDHLTGLMWEKKTTHGKSLGDPNYADPHDNNNYYSWSVSVGGTAADGTAYTDFLSKLNNGASTDGGASTPITGCFANHCDWRLPSVVELQEVVDTARGYCGCQSGACIDPIFGATQDNSYWSATTDSGLPTAAYQVNFLIGAVGSQPKNYNYYLRAVRGGS